MILPMTGPSQSTGKQEEAGAKLYIQQHGDTVAGKKIKLEIKDDTGAADVTKRLAQELIANDHASGADGLRPHPARARRRARSRPKRRCPKSSPPPRPR